MKKPMQRMLTGGVVGAVACLMSFCLASWCNAAEVTSDQAMRAVRTWLRDKPQLGCRLGATVSGVRTCRTGNGIAFHVVKLDGGGFVVTSSDTETEPIIAFSESDNLVECDENPLWVLLNRDLSSRSVRRRQLQASKGGVAQLMAQSLAERKWTHLLPAVVTNALARTLHAATGKASVSDVRVAPLLKTRWNQEQDAYYSNRGDPCYNYYTPEHYPCGCVATAAAQIMRYHTYPTDSVVPGTYVCRVMTGKQWIDAGHYYPIYENRILTQQGGLYAWDDMPFVPADGTTLAQRQAIGKLTSDIGIACLMAYGEGGSSAGGYMPAKALKERFQYANAVAYVESDLPVATLLSAVVPNLDAKLPVLLGLNGDSGGHAVVADGYGYSMETFYLHINMGYAGSEDAWYAPPAIGDYSAIDSIVCNISPDGVDDAVICSGRVLSSDGGKPLSAVAVTASFGETSFTTTTDKNGIYAFLLSAGTYRLASSGTSLEVTLADNVGSEITDDGYYYVKPISVGNLYDCNLVVAQGFPPVDPTPEDPSEDRSSSLIEGDVLPVDADEFVATTYDGYLYCEADGTLAGTIQVKAAKAKMDKKNGKTTTALTALLQIADETKKISIKGSYDLGLAEEQSFPVKNRGELALYLGANGLVGSFEGYAIEAVPNVFSEKDAASKSKDSAADAAYVGAYNLIAEEGVFSVAVTKKGKVKVTGTTAAGKTVSVSTQLLVGERVACVPVVAPKLGLVFTVWLGESATVKGLTNVVFGQAGMLPDGSVFTFDAKALVEQIGDDAYAEYFPCGISVAQVGTKWVVAPGADGKAAKAGKVVLKKDKSGVDETKLGENPSALKLNYTAKTGAFKGTFNAYVNSKGNPKSVTVTVTGLMIGDCGYGMATVKKSVPIPIRIGL